MLLKAVKRNTGKLLALVMAVSLLMSITASATTVNVLDGQVSIADSANSNTESNGTVTIKATGSLTSKKTNNITITNQTENKAALSFDYTVTSANSFKIANATAATSGSYSVVMEAGGSLSITLVSNSGLSNRTATLKLSNFSFVVAKDSSNITFEYDSTYGSVTVDGSAVSNEGVVEIPLAGAALVATTANGGKFLGWVDDSSKILSTNASYTLTPASDMTVKAVFVGANSAPHFGVGAAAQKSESVGLLGMSKLNYYIVSLSYIFDNLSEATAQASEDSVNKTVVLLNSGVLSAGDHTIPSGVTMLIPFDEANTMYTTEAQSIMVNDIAYSVPSAYRTLTLADGAKLKIDGSVSVSAKHCCAQGSKDVGGAPTGNVGFIKMEGTSSIEVSNGGALYAWGFVTGSGSVTVNDGGTVYECFQVADFRGGSQSTDMENGVFPLSQYYVQNIEVPMTLMSGAKEYCGMTAYMSSSKFFSAVNFISKSGAMFNMSDGCVVTKKYDGTTDRLIVDVDGNISFKRVGLSVGTSSIDSSKFDLGVNGNITININSGTFTVQQNLALLPGCVINIGENAKMVLGTVDESGWGGGNHPACIYVYDADEWGNFCYSVSNKPFGPVKYAPSRTYTRTVADLVDASVMINGEVDATGGYIYTTAGAASIYSTGNGSVTINPGTQTVTYQLVQGTGYTEIPITSAKLRNDVNRYGESYTVTAGSTGSTTYTYDLISGTWGTKEVTVVPVYNGVAYTNNAETGYALDSSAELAGYYSDATLKTPATEISGGSTVYRLAAATIIDGGSIEGYTKLSSAVKDYQNSGYIQMQQIGSEPGYIVDKDIILDLNKCDVYVGGATATIKGIDSGTNGYECADENLGSLSGVAADKIASTATVNGKHYLAITESDKTTFHRVAVSLTRYALKNPHLIVEGTFRGTTAAYDKLSDMGFNFDKNIVAPDPNNAEKTVETNNVWFGKKPAETTTGSGSTTVQFSFSAAAGTDYEVTPQMKLLTIALDKNNNPVYDILSGTKRTISIQAVLDAIAPPTTEEGV